MREGEAAADYAEIGASGRRFALSACEEAGTTPGAGMAVLDARMSVLGGSPDEARGFTSGGSFLWVRCLPLRRHF